MTLPSRSVLFALAVALAMAGGPPAQAAEWITSSTTSSHTRSHCWVNDVPSCWVTYTDSSVSYKGHFGSQQDASAACNAMLKGLTCSYASGEPGPSLMSGGWEVTCPGGINQYGLCTSTLRRHVTAYFYTVVVEQDVERPPDCPAVGRRFGNPIDGLTGEKHEQLILMPWSSQAPPLTLHYRSGKFARQVSGATFQANNVAGKPAATGSVGLGIPDGAGAMPFGPLWTHDLDTRITTGPGHARLNRMAGGGGLTFRGATDGSQMLPPGDQADRLTFMGGGGATWRHRDPRTRRTHYFSATGMLVHVVNADGTGRQWLTYSDTATPRSLAAGPDRLLAIRDASGRQLRLSYLVDTQGQATDLIGATIDDQGAATAFSYDAMQRLSEVRWPDGSTQRFTYDTALPWALSARIDEAGVANGNWTWNPANGLVTSTSRADGVDRHVLRFAQAPQVTVSDTIEGRLIRRRYSWQPGVGAEVTGPTGATVALGAALRHGSLQLERRSQPAGAGCNASQSTMALDGNGNPTVKNDFAGARTCHAYDMARNLEVVRVEGLDQTANCAALLAVGATLPPGARKISTRWHPVWPIVEVEARPGRIETSVYNGRPDPFAGGAAASCMPWLGGGEVPVDDQPAALCRLVRRATSDSNGSLGFAAALDPSVPPREERWRYTALGQPSSHDGPRTDVADITTWRYHDSTGPVARAGDLAEVRNGLGQSTRFDHWSATGLLLSWGDANGVTTTLGYDLRQRLVRVDEAAGTTWSRQTLQTWDSRGLLLSVQRPGTPVANGGATVWGSAPQQVRHEYDRAHRLVGVFSGNRMGESYQLDAAGQVLTRTLHHGDDRARPPTVLTSEYDALGRPWRTWTVIQGVPRATELEHDAMGRLTSIRRPTAASQGESLAPVEQRRYDALGRLARIESNILGAQQPIVMSHAASDTLTSVTSTNGSRFEFQSDGFGQVQRERLADSGETTRQHDAAGNLLTVIDARGVTTRHDYDALNRRIRTERHHGHGSGDGEGIVYVWDHNQGSPLPCRHGIGRLCRIDDATGSRHFAYDAFGNLVEQWSVELGQVHRQTFGWDTQGRLIAMSDGGGTASLRRSGEGHVTMVNATVSGHPSLVSLQSSLRADGEAQHRMSGNQVVEQRQFDSSGALAGQTVRARPR